MFYHAPLRPEWRLTQGLLIAEGCCPSPKAFYCPSEKVPCLIDGLPMTFEFHWPMGFTGYITRSDYGETWPAGHDSWYDYRIYRIDGEDGRGPNGQKSYVSDYVRINTDYDYTHFPQWRPEHLVHNGGWNVWYLDGHAKNVVYKERFGTEYWFPTPWRRIWRELFDLE